MLDLGMPRLNGYDVCRQIRDQDWGKKVCVIALSGWGQDEDRRRSSAAGFDHHLVKPVEAAALMQVMSAMADDPLLRCRDRDRVWPPVHGLREP